MRLFTRLAALVAAASLAVGQVEAPAFVHVDAQHDTGRASNPSDQRSVVHAFTVHRPGALWLRLYFDEVELAGDVFAGTGATLRLTGWRDGAVMEMNAVHVAQWQSSSCYFNGDKVEVEVVAPPRSGGSRVVLRGYDVGVAGTVTQTICDSTDDRILSTDPRSARLLPIGCTGWLIDDCARCLLTAGHCTGSLQVVEFNVPLSDSSGNLVHPPPEDQYAVDPASLQTNGGAGVGNDWGYFGTFANAVTGLTAYQAQGAAFSLSLPPTPSGNDIRITGYGTDSSPPERNQVQQTNVGPLVVSNPTADVGYRTDTTGGNSGSPVIWEQTGDAVGIHTHGGCSSTGGNNWGTAVGNAGLQAALASPAGVCAAGFSLADLPTILAPGVRTTVTVTVLSASATNVTLWYRYDGGSFLPLAMTTGGSGLYQADLPPASCGDDPDFFFTLDDPSCGAVAAPPGAPNDWFDAEVGSLVTVFADDFQTNTGWTATNLGATTGDWQRGVPVDDPGWDYDPTSDADGSGRCYLTQNQVGNTDVDNGAVRLESPSFDLTGGGLISYQYYGNMTSPGSDMLLVEASDNGTAGPWVEVARHDTNGGTTWRSHAIQGAELVGAGLTLGPDMRLRFTANDSDPQSIHESGLDAFFVGRIDCGDGIGTRYCTPAVVNSSGLSAEMEVTGSDVVADNSVVLNAGQLPPNEFGYFLTSQTQGFVLNPGGSAGNLCLGGTIGRYSSSVLSSGAGGAFSLPIDLTDMPDPTSGTVQVGETWNFTAWFRDGSTNNFADGVAVLFQ